MPYLGQRPSKGDENNFKILDDISSYTLTFDGSDASVVSAANDTITSLNHRFVQGQRVTYNKGGGGVIAGLSDGVYYIIKHDHHTIKLATSASNATNGIAVNITNVGSGSSHTLNVAFDGVNTKFKATHTNGQKAKITRSAQLVISVNGVIQQPHDSATPSTGFGFDLDGTIVLSQAPVAGDVYWAHVLTNNNVTFDISDNDVDNFTGNGSTVSFNLSKTPPDNRNVLVTIDGVVQYPNDPDGTVRAYNVVENVLTFTTAPDANVQIQVRHIGFAGSTSGGGGSGVTNFYGRTGSVTLINTDNIVANNAEFAGNLTVQGTMTTLDTKVTEVDQLEVAANNTTVGVAITQSGSGDILNLYDGSTQVVTVDDTGSIGIGSAIPSQKLDVVGKVKIKDTGGDVLTLTSTTASGRTTLKLNTNGNDWELGARGSSGNPNNSFYVYDMQSSAYGMVIDSSGRVMIGGTTAASTLTTSDDLTISTSGSTGITLFSASGYAGNITFGDGTSGDDRQRGLLQYHHLDDSMRFFTNADRRMTIASDGKVGIGTVPLHAFEILSGADHENIIQVKGTNSAGVYAGMGVYQGNAVFTGGGIGSNSAGLVFRIAASGSETEALRITSTGLVQVGKDNQSSTTFTQDLDIRGRYVNAVGDFARLLFRNSTDSGNSSASIRAQRTGDNYGTELSFFTQASGLGSGGDGTERLRINASGNARLGGTSNTTDQGYRFTLQGSANATYLQFFDNGTGTTHGSDGSFVGLINQDFYVWNRETKAVVIGSSNNERLRITSDGKVGVGDFTSGTAVSQAFHVKGSQPEIYLEHTGGYDLTMTTNDGAGQCGINPNGGALSLAYNNKNIWMCRTGGYVAVGHNSPITRLDVKQNNGVGYNGNAQTAAYNAARFFNESGHVSGGTYTGLQFNITGNSQNRICSIGMISEANNSKASSLVFHTDDNGNRAEKLRITSTGKVSLGSAPMTTPPSWLHVKGNTYQTLRLENYDGGGNGPYIELYNNSASPANNDYTGIISFKNRNSAAEEITYSQIRSQSTDVIDGTEDGVLTFHTRHNGTFGERLRIRANGNIVTNLSTGAVLEMTRTSTSTSGLCGKIVFGNTDWDSSMASIQAYQDGGNDNASLRFYTQASASGGEQERVRIGSSGRVSIGVNHSSIQAALNVKGNNDDGNQTVLLRLGNDSSGSGTGSAICMGAGAGASSQGATIAGFYDGTGTAFTIGTNASFNGSTTERLRVHSDGQVEINPTGGTGYLRIYKDRDTAYSSNGGNNQDLIVQQISDSTNTQGYSSIGLQCNYAGQTGAWVALNAVRTAVGEADLTINPRNNSTGDVEKARFTSSGNLIFSNTSNLVINNSKTNGSMTIGANVGTSAYTSIKGSSYVRVENYVSTGSATWLERWKVYQHGMTLQPTRHGDSIESKSGGIYYVLNGATPLNGTYNSDTDTPLMRCGHSWNGTMYIWMVFNGTEFHNGCRQQIIHTQGTYGYASHSVKTQHNQNALGAGLNSLNFSYQNAGTPNYYFKVRGTWASGQNQPYILWTWVGMNSEYPYAL